MSFSESDYPSLVNQIERILNEYSNDEFVRDILKEIVVMAKKIPLYPGIAAGCAAKMVQAIKLEDVKKGEKILAEFGENKSVYGEVTGIDKDNLSIKETRLKPGEIRKILRINTKVLEEDWPTLIFPEEY